MSKKPTKRLDAHSRANLNLAKPTTRIVTLPAQSWAVRGIANKIFRSRAEAEAAAKKLFGDD